MRCPRWAADAATKADEVCRRVLLVASPSPPGSLLGYLLLQRAGVVEVESLAALSPSSGLATRSLRSRSERGSNG